jgi:hypothetical protein
MGNPNYGTHTGGGTCGEAPTITINNPDSSYASSKTISATASDGTLEMSITTGSVCNSSLTFSSYSETTFTSESDNGKKVCYRATDLAGNTGYSTLSSPISGIDTSTPNIVAIDAGASSSDRTSLTSGLWFKSSNTGDDDKISFSWTDPSSVSDDIFYYEINSNSGSTITGDETSTTNNYIDEITITEGTNYFHIKPKNGAGTWGTERIFTIKYDKTAPSSVTSDVDESWHNAAFDVTLNCTDVGSDCTVYYCTYLTGNESDCTPNTNFVSSGSTFEFDITGSSTLKYKAVDLAGNESEVSTDGKQLKIDTSAPTISDDYLTKDGIIQTTDQTITLSAIDSASGVKWIKYCTESSTCTPDHVYDENNKPAITTEGTTYFRYTAQDNAGTNQEIITRTVIIDKPDTNTANTTSSGGSRSGGSIVSKLTNHHQIS